MILLYYSGYYIEENIAWFQKYSYKTKNSEKCYNEKKILIELSELYSKQQFCLAIFKPKLLEPSLRKASQACKLVYRNVRHVYQSIYIS